MVFQMPKLSQRRAKGFFKQTILAFNRDAIDIIREYEIVSFDKFLFSFEDI